MWREAGNRQAALLAGCCMRVLGKNLLRCLHLLTSTARHLLSVCLCVCRCLSSQGKTFQCALAYKKLGISPIVMSAGEWRCAVRCYAVVQCGGVQ